MIMTVFQFEFITSFNRRKIKKSYIINAKKHKLKNVWQIPFIIGFNEHINLENCFWKKIIRRTHFSDFSTSSLKRRVFNGNWLFRAKHTFLESKI